MIEEDIQSSEQVKMELIYQREELEQYSESLKNESIDLQLISSISENNRINPDDEEAWGKLVIQLLEAKQRHLLLDLIRELHQYILGLSSNTTENSVMQSEELEDLSSLIEKETLSVEEAVELISEVA